MKYLVKQGVKWIAFSLFFSGCGSGGPPPSSSGSSAGASSASSSGSSGSYSPSGLLCVLTSGFYRILSFDPTLSGNLAPYRSMGDLTSLSVPNGASASEGAIAIDETNNQIYVAITSRDAVNVYQRTSFGTGNILPIRTLTGSGTGLSGPNGLVLDLTHDELFVANSTNHSITVYARTASGNMAPTRTLSGSSTLLATPMGIALDSEQNLLWVANKSGGAGTGSLTAYARTAKGDTAPKTSSPATPVVAGLSSPVGLAIDTQNRVLLVANAGGTKAITAYSLADGSLAYTQTLSVSPKGIALNPDGQKVFVTSGSTTTSAITALQLTNSSTVTQLFDLSGDKTDLYTPTAIAADNTHSEIAVLNTGKGMLSLSLFSQTETSDGLSHNVPALRALTPKITGLGAPIGIGADLARQEIFVSNQNSVRGDSINTYSLTAGGSALPKRTLTGALTLLENPSGVAADPKNNEIYVVNSTSHSINVYNRTDSGNTPPKRRIVDPVDLLTPTAILVEDLVAHMIFVAEQTYNSVFIYDIKADGLSTPSGFLAAPTVKTPTALALDLPNAELWVANSSNHSVAVFSLTSFSLVRQLIGSKTLLNQPVGVTVDSARNTVAVVNGGSNSILVFQRTGFSTSGNVAPLSVISGPQTTLNSPVGSITCQ